MDPNNNQQMNNQPAAPQAPANNSMSTQPAQTMQSTQPAQAMPPKNSKRIILLVILLVLLVGMAGYIYFVKQQVTNLPKNTGANTTTVLPSPTLVPTATPPASAADVSVDSPVTDLNNVDSDLLGL